MSQPEATGETGFDGRCYCGACSVRTFGTPITVAYCHCADCKRWTGSPLPAFAAFPKGSVVLEPASQGRSFATGVTRWTCEDCGSPMMATFDYLPEQIYVPLGVINEADRLIPEVHCHAQSELEWLHISDALPREKGSARKRLSDAGQK